MSTRSSSPQCKQPQALAPAVQWADLDPKVQQELVSLLAQLFREHLRSRAACGNAAGKQVAHE